MTLRGDRVTCDVPGCETRPIVKRRAWNEWYEIQRASLRYWDICPACRARYADDQLRDMLARKET